MSNSVLADLYPATNLDVPRLPWLLESNPEKVIVRNLWFITTFLLADFAKPPFVVLEEDGYFVLHGLDAKSSLPASLRIVEEGEFTNILQYRNERYRVWGSSPPGNILFLPDPHGAELKLI